jgi:hypothetical protein
MQLRNLTRYSTIAVFLFTCCLTVDVNARERDLAPQLSRQQRTPSKTILTPEALQLLSDAEAYLQGFTPAEVTPFELEPRRPAPKSALVKRPNSRVKVKFADNLKVRLDVHDSPYSSTGRASAGIKNLVDSLGISLKPAHSDPVAEIDALVAKVERYSGKQQPDLAGIYWVVGDTMSVDTAAEMLHASDDVEWVMYSPLLIRPTDSVRSLSDFTNLDDNYSTPSANPTSFKKRPAVIGACRFSTNDCENDLPAENCVEMGGTFLGPNSVCQTVPSSYISPQNLNSNTCSTVLTPEVAELVQRMLDDGTWEEYRTRDVSSRGVPPTQYVKVTVHSVSIDADPGPSNPAGTLHVPQANVNAAIAQLNINVASTGLVFCQSGPTDLINCTPLIFAAQSDMDAVRVANPVENTMNVWFLPSGSLGSAQSSFPNYGLQGIVIDNLFVDPADPASGGNYSVFSHEVGHYFGLFHTHETSFGVECVERINCGFAGDLLCDTAADPLLAGLVSPPLCTYSGTALDPCGSGLPYTPPTTNLMSYADAACINMFTTEQLSVMLSIAETDRLGHLSSTMCDAIPASDSPSECEPDPDTPLPPGPQDAICCFIATVSGYGPGCIDTDQATCDSFNGIMMPADPPQGGASICEDFDECDPPPVDEYSVCGECGDYVTYFAGDCYIDQTTYIQANRTGNPGCLDTRLRFNDYGDFTVPTNVLPGPDAGCEFQNNCCTNLSTNFPWCDPEASYPNDWDAACASYAISDAFYGLGNCSRSAQNVNPCTAPFGPMQGIERQPLINPDLAGINIDVTVLDNPSNITFEMEIVEQFNVRNINLYFTTTGGMESVVTQNISTGTSFVISQTASWIEYTAANFGITLTAECCSYSGCCYGMQPPDVSDTCEELWTNACAQSSGFLGTFPRQAFAVDEQTQLYAMVINTSVNPGVPIARCASPLGLSSTTRVAPNPENGTPDFAKMGLMMWMSEDEIPYLPANLGDPEQLYALPNMTTKMTPEEIDQLHRLVPWPMGGASSVSGGANFVPPVMSPDGTINWGGEGHNLFPAPPNPGGFGGMHQYSGAYGYGQQWEDEGLGINGAFGNNVKVAVLDWSAHVQEAQNDVGLDLGGIHAELTHVKLEGRDTPHDPVELIFDENLTNNWFPFSADHGTGILGIIGAQWGPNSAPGVDLETRLDNNIGVLGMVPDAEIYFFPLATIDDPVNLTDGTGGRIEDAWLHAIGTLDPGDIICAGYRPVVVSLERPNLNYWDDSNMYLGFANDAGICTVIQAGYGASDTSGGVDLGLIDPEDGDQGAIVATSVSPGNPWKRMADGEHSSNYSSVADYSKVTVSSWGMAVTTCGKGPSRDNYLGFLTCLYDDATNAHDVHEYAYTNNFGGTSAAAAVAAGSVAILQGFTKQIYDIPMSPMVTRQLVAGGRYQGVDKDGNPVMPWKDPSTEINSSECETSDFPSNTWDLCGVPSWMTGTLADPRTGMLNTIYSPIFSTPYIDSIIIVRGDFIWGSMASIAANDGNLFIVEGVPTAANYPYDAHENDPNNEVPGDYVRYPSGGNVTDIFLTGTFESNLPALNKLNIEINFETTQPDQFYLRCEMWDIRNARWVQATATTVVVQGTEDVALEVQNASRFIDRTTYQYYLRLTTAVTNIPGGEPLPAIPIQYDQILVKNGLLQRPRP